MSYIGRQISNLSDRVKLDAITASATATYNLLLNTVAYVPSSAESLTVSLNGVIQAPQDSYTVSGSQITFASTLSASDSIDFILAERSITLQTPSAGSVGLTQLSATGTKDATTFLRGDNTFATVTSTTINNNADNRVITGSGTANTLEGEANVTYADPKLMVANSGDSTFEIQSGNTSQCRLNFGDTDSSTIGQIRYTHSDNTMKFESNGAERMRFKSSGTLSVNVSAATNTKNEWALKLHQNTNDAATNYMMVFANASDTTLGSIQTNGTSSTSYLTSSDYRLKENEVAIPDGIERLKQLKPYRFNFKADADKTVDGFFAHEVSSVVPEAISGEKDAVDSEGNIIPQGIDQSKLVPLLTKALQEAITKIETLEAENTDIKARLTALENA